MSCATHGGISNTGAYWLRVVAAVMLVVGFGDLFLRDLGFGFDLGPITA